MISFRLCADIADIADIADADVPADCFDENRCERRREIVTHVGKQQVARAVNEFGCPFAS